MARVLILVVAFLLAVAVATSAGLIAVPSQRPECQLMFLEVTLDDPDLAAYQVYAPLYVCPRTVA